MSSNHKKSKAVGAVSREILPQLPAEQPSEPTKQPNLFLRLHVLGILQQVALQTPLLAFFGAECCFPVKQSCVPATASAGKTLHHHSTSPAVIAARKDGVPPRRITKPTKYPACTYGIVSFSSYFTAICFHSPLTPCSCDYS